MRAQWHAQEAAKSQKRQRQAAHPKLWNSPATSDKQARSSKKLPKACLQFPACAVRSLLLSSLLPHSEGWKRPLFPKTPLLLAMTESESRFGVTRRVHPNLCRFVPIIPFSSDLFRFAFQISSDLCFLFVPICSDFVRVVFRTSQNQSGQPLCADPFANPRQSCPLGRFALEPLWQFHWKSTQ